MDETSVVDGHLGEGFAFTKRNLGAFYTPTPVVDLMVEQLDGLNANSVVLEPSGGDGAFVDGVLRVGTVGTDQIHVWDLNPDVGQRFAELGVGFTCRDGLLGRGSTATHPVTHVVGNPPYLNKQSAYVRQNRAELKKVFKDIGASETYAMFTYRALEEVTVGGQVVFLIADTWLTLGSHEKFRRYLLQHTIRSVTLLPRSVFPDATVRTVILDVVKSPPSPTHEVAFKEYPESSDSSMWWESEAAVTSIRQGSIAKRARSEFVHHPDLCEALDVAAQCQESLLDVCDGGLGMYTRNNSRYLKRVHRGHVESTPAGWIHHSAVDGVQWRWYHKTGGATRWWGPAEHAVRWDATSQRQYVRPATSHAGDVAEGAPAKEGIVVSGISSQLCARVGTLGALWESNKAFVLFPRNPQQHPHMFILAVLNSRWYGTLARALNNTVSFQVRDLRGLPLLPFTAEEIRTLARLGEGGVRATQRATEGLEGAEGDLVRLQERIDAVVDVAVRRVRMAQVGDTRHVAA